MSELDERFEQLKAKLLTMASLAEAAVLQSLRALLRRNERLAHQTKEEDVAIDRMEVEVDRVVHGLLEERALDRQELLRVTTAMKIAQDLEEPRLDQVEAFPEIAEKVLRLLKEALDTFVAEEPGTARALIPRDKEVDALNRKIQGELTEGMMCDPAVVPRALNLMIISRSLERIGDHAKNIAEMVVYLCEGRDIRHGGSVDRSPSPDLSMAGKPPR